MGPLAADLRKDVPQDWTVWIPNAQHPAGLSASR